VSILSGWRFCPRDATELVHEPDHLRCPACGERYWANSVPGVQVVLERDGLVLLGRRRDDPGAGRWDLPGGFLHEGEGPLDGLRREVREETGLEVEQLEFLGSWNEPYWNRTVLCLTWLGRAAGGEERPGDDLVELAWFSPDDRPRDGELAFATFEEILTLWSAR
jgi:ADP-ribose pyrophosphatase YjhB (NUDIX family)